MLDAKDKKKLRKEAQDRRSLFQIGKDGIGDKLIEREVLNVPNEKARAVVLENLRLIEQDNRRDFRF